jgi:hypothetical protein
VIISEKGNFKISIVIISTEIITIEILKLPFLKKKMYIKIIFGTYCDPFCQKSGHQKKWKTKITYLFDNFEKR